MLSASTNDIDPRCGSRRPVRPATRKMDDMEEQAENLRIRTEKKRDDKKN